MNTSLIAMAAGMGSRFGGLKQVSKFGSSKKTMLDLAIEDAMQASINKIVFIIRKDIEKIFRDEISKKYENIIDVNYVFQDASEYKLPDTRSKPWGTGHAILCAKDIVREPFIAINADDYYGQSVYAQMKSFLDKAKEKEYALCGYLLKNTLSKNGGVSRGICLADEALNLKDINEYTGLKSSEGKVISNEGEFFDGNEYTSLNFWGFNADFMDILATLFDKFYELNHKDSKAEFYLPSAVDYAIKNNIAKVKVLPSDEIWQGVTYKEDVATVEKYLKETRKI